MSMFNTRKYFTSLGGKTFKDVTSKPTKIFRSILSGIKKAGKRKAAKKKSRR